MSIVKTRFITRTGVLLSLALVFQLAGRYLTPLIGTNSNFVVGPLVNACLIIATASVSLWSGGLIAVAAPFGAILTGAAVPLAFAPFIAVGNFLLVLCFYLIKKNYYIGILVGSIVKFGFLFASIACFLKLFQNILKIPQKVGEVLLVTFSWPQLITSLLGGTIALAVIKSLGKNIEI